MLNKSGGVCTKEVIDMFKEKLRVLREKRRLTQESVAQELGVTRPTYTRYETGEREPDYEMLKKIAVFYRVSVDYLLGLTDKPTPPYMYCDIFTAFVQRIELLALRDNVNVQRVLMDCDIGADYADNVRDGSVVPALDDVVRIAEHFNVSVDFMMGFTMESGKFKTPYSGKSKMRAYVNGRWTASLTRQPMAEMPISDWAMVDVFPVSVVQFTPK